MYAPQAVGVPGVLPGEGPMLERFEFAGPARGPMAVLRWQGFEVRCTEWPESLLSLLKAGALGPLAAQEARELAEALAEGL